VSSTQVLELVLAAYLFSTWIVAAVLHHGDFKSRIQELRTRRTIGISALALSPVTLVVILLALLYLGLRRIGHEIAVYVGFDEGVVDEQ